MPDVWLLGNLEAQAEGRSVTAPNQACGCAYELVEDGAVQRVRWFHEPSCSGSCICYPGMCPMGCEPACPYCYGGPVLDTETAQQSTPTPVSPGEVSHG